MSIANNEINETKKRIIDISLDLFSTHGFKGTSIRQIAQEVGIKGSSIYNHFSSKDDILQSIFNVYRPHSLRDKLLNKDYIEEAKQNPNQFPTSIKLEIRNLYNDKNWQKLLKLTVIEMFQNDSIKTLMNKNIMAESLDTYSLFFSILKENNLIKDIDSAVLGNMISNIVLMSNLKILLDFDTPTDNDITIIEDQLDVLWNSIKI